MPGVPASGWIQYSKGSWRYRVSIARWDILRRQNLSEAWASLAFLGEAADRLWEHRRRKRVAKRVGRKLVRMHLKPQKH
jgi:hypothetical protein